MDVCSFLSCVVILFTRNITGIVAPILDPQMHPSRLSVHPVSPCLFRVYLQPRISEIKQFDWLPQLQFSFYGRIFRKSSAADTLYPLRNYSISDMYHHRMLVRPLRNKSPPLCWKAEKIQ
jgi:hypothetical protein